MSGPRTVVRPVRQSRQTSIVLGTAGAAWSTWSLWKSWSDGDFEFMQPWQIAALVGFALIAVAVIAWFSTASEVVVTPHTLQFASEGEAIEVPTVGAEIVVVKEIDPEYEFWAVQSLPDEEPPRTTKMYIQLDGDPTTRRAVDIAQGLTPRRMQGFKDDLEHAIASTRLAADPIFRSRPHEHEA